MINRYEHIFLGGFHIEEAVYGPLYYYPDGLTPGTHEFEVQMPGDTILVHLITVPEVIEVRMNAPPHQYQLIKKSDIPTVRDRFRQEVQVSWIQHKIEIDTSDLTPGVLLQTFLDRSIPHLNTRDLLTRLAEK